MWKVIVAGLLLGAAVSGLSLPLTGQREAFDASPAWYLTATFLAGALATLPAPRFWWLAVLAVFLGAHAWYAAVYPDMRPWLLFGLVINAIVPTWWPAAVGALLVYLGARVVKQCSPSRSPDVPREDRS
jgi:hypothetical protein